MNLLKIWDSEYPWDVRAEKVMRSLTAAGHEVHLVARNRSRSLLEERLDEATVHRLRPWSWLGSGLDAMSQFPAFMNPRWMFHIFSHARRCSAEAIIVRDLPLAPTAIWAGRALKIPVILDMAENYPAMVRDIWLGGRQGPLDFLVRNPTFVSAVERWSVRAIDHIIVVVEESGERLVHMGVDPDRITVVCNTPWPTRIPDESALDRTDTQEVLRMVYLGLLEKPRGLGTVLKGVALLRDGGVRTRLDVVGGGMDAETFHSQATRLGLSEEVVRFHGVLPHEEALAIFLDADVGLVPHLAVESWNTTLPNKLFDYMSHGLPVLTSDAKPAARIVRELGSGVVFQSDNHEDFARALGELGSSEARERMRNNGRQAVLTRYNWKVDGARLLRAVEATVQRTRAGPA